MNTSLLCIAHSPQLRAAFRYGRDMAGRLHVSTTRREIVRYVVGRLNFKDGLARVERNDRRALYVGVMAGLRAERRLMAAFSL